MQHIYATAAILICSIFTTGWPCPEYDVKADPSFRVQQREYPSFQAISAISERCGNFSEALLSGYSALFRYRKGKKNV